MPGKRKEIGVTLADLEILSRMLDRQPITLAAAASALSVQRAYLYRMIERINGIIGDPALEWRQRGGIVLPPEVRRLVRAYRAFRDSRDDLVRFPRVSAGSRASLLLSVYLSRIDHKAARMMVVRSRETAEALRSERIDVAVLHEKSLDSHYHERQSIALEFMRLLPWSSIEVSSKTAPGRQKVVLTWEPSSLGALLNPREGEEDGDDATIVHAMSFSQALELARRGIVGRLVLPDIYLSAEDRRNLALRRMARPYEDHLVAVFRAEDRERLSWLLDVEVWRTLLSPEHSEGSGHAHE